MYLAIGDDMSVRTDTIIGIFDLDNTSWSKHTRSFLRQAEENGSVIPAGNELPKSFLLTGEMGMEHIYLTRFNAATLEKRLSKIQKRRPSHGR